MTVKYVDFLNGDDGAGDGSSGNPYKSIQTASTGLTGGDEVRIAKSPDSQTATPTATWTQGSDTIVLSVAQNLEIDDCEDAWTDGTGAAKCTCTTYFGEMEGTYCAQFTIVSGWGGSGLAAYWALPGGATDFSAYEQVSFWVRSSIAIADGKWSLRLCSDAAGTTPVDTIPIKFHQAVGYFGVCVADTGGALGSSIQSIALYSEDGSPGTPVIYLDNIVACKASGSADEITHLTLLSPSAANYGWYCPQVIKGTDIVLGAGSTTTSKWTCEWSDATITDGTLYTRQPIFPRFATSYTEQIEVVSSSGTGIDSLLKISGGWDLTGPTQNGETHVHYGGGAGYLIYVSAKHYLHFDSIGLYAGNYNWYLASSNFVKCTNCYAAYASYTPFSIGGGQCYVDGCYFLSSYRMSMYLSGINDCYITNSVIGGNNTADACLVTYRVGTARIENCKFYTGQSTTGFIAQGLQASGTIEIVGCTGYNAEGADCYLSSGGNITFRNWNTDSATRMVSHAVNDGMRSVVKFENINGNSEDHQIWSPYYNITSDNSVRHTDSGISWKLSPTATNCTVDSPAKMVIAKLLCKANTAVTVSAWFRRTNTGVTAKLVMPKGQLSGLTTEQTDSMSAAADTWEQLSVTFTPTQTGVVEIEAQVYGGTTYSVYVDDVEAS